MANKKKIATSAVAVGVAASLLLGGTFAWQSISQTALNEKEAVINPGGRLHDDFDGTNKDVYVENFAENDIYARIRLDEYFEIVMNKGTAAEKTEQIAGTDKDDISTYVTHLFDATNTTDTYWKWTTGGSITYMPTFNMNKDSLVADINGTMDYVNDEGNPDPYGDYVDYSKEENKTKTATEIYDGDSNTVDEVKSDFENLDKYADNIKTIENAEHTVKTTGTATLISMADWLELDEDDDTDNYWVYDTDGWVYYSSPIKAGEATGLLLDEIGLTQVMDDSYYYAINVVAQFITADDLGRNDKTGFYQDVTKAPSDNALTLLKKIGVDISEASDEDAENGTGDENTIQYKTMKLTSLSDMQTTYATAIATYDSSEEKYLYFTDPEGNPVNVNLTSAATYGSGVALSVDNGDYVQQDSYIKINCEKFHDNTMIMVMSENNSYIGKIVVNNTSELILAGTTVGDTTYCVSPKINEGITLRLNSSSGDQVTNLEGYTLGISAASKILEANTDYTFADGTLKIINTDYVGKPISIQNSSLDVVGNIIPRAAE